MTGFILLQSLVITINYNSSQSIFSWTLLLWLLRTRPILILVLSTTDLICDWATYIASRQTHRKHICSPAVDICEPQKIYLLDLLDWILHGVLQGALPSQWAVYPESVSAGMCLPSHCPAMGLHVTLWWKEDVLSATSGQVGLVLML
jgi:hypothetical protein